MKWDSAYVICASIIASAFSFLIALQGQGVARLPGCGARSGCAAMASSRWSRWMNIPVALIAAFIYLLISIATFWVQIDPGVVRINLLLSAPVGAATLGGLSAFWFISLEFVVVRRQCFYCNLVHLLGLIILVLLVASAHQNLQNWIRLNQTPVLFGIGAFLVLVLGQIVIRPKSYAIVRAGTQTSRDPIAEAISKISHGPAIDTKRSEENRQASLRSGKLLLNSGDWPMLGTWQAVHIIALAFDYTCPVCRLVHNIVGKIEGASHLHHK